MGAAERLWLTTPGLSKDQSRGTSSDSHEDRWWNVELVEAEYHAEKDIGDPSYYPKPIVRAAGNQKAIHPITISLHQ